MSKLNIPRHNVPTPDEAFNQMLGVKTNPSKNGIVEIEFNKLIPFETLNGEPQPFNLYSQEDLEQLAEGIKLNGIHSPVIVRPHKEKTGCYEIIAGHNRTNAGKLAGLSTIPCIIKDVDDVEANVIMLDTNLDQRKKLSFSELAKAYKMKLDIENSQGKRTDLTLRQNVVKFTAAEKRKAQRYARLTYLVADLMGMVDSKQLPLTSGIELSYIDNDNQQSLFDYISQNNKKLTSEDAEQLRELDKKEVFDNDILNNFFNTTKPKQVKPKKSISIKVSDISEYVDVELEDAKDYILKALKFYKDNACDD